MSISKLNGVSSHGVKRRKIQHDSDDAHGHESPVSSANQVMIDDGMEGESINHGDQHQDGVVSRSHQVTRATKVVTGPQSAANMLQAQLRNLLSEVSMDYDTLLKKSKSMIDLLLQFIKDTNGVDPMSFDQAQKYAKEKLNVKVPWTLRTSDEINYRFGFQSPARTTLEGPFCSKIGLKGQSKILIVPQMPENLFQDKDFLDQRALHKRAFYLACIASNIQKSASPSLQLSFAFHEDNHFVAVLRIVSSQDPGLVFDISPSLPASLGPIDKTKPTQNCLRKSKANKTSESSPFYNGTLRQLASISAIRDMMNGAAEKAEHFHEACRISAIWLQRRGFSSSRTQGGFGVEEWALLCALLLESGGHQGRPLFSPRYSAVQLFKAILQVLSTRDIMDPFVLRGSTQIDSSNIPVIFDAHTGVNVLYKMSPWAYAKLRRYATSSLVAVNSKIESAFDATFATNVCDSILEYDEIYQFQSKQISATLGEVQSHLHDVLQRGLGDRIRLLDLRTSTTRSWKLNSSIKGSELPNIVIGLSIQPDTASRLIDHGPSVEDKDATEEFRDFWGQKAELRRFKDGRINESVVWSAGTPVTQQIVQYLLVKYFGAQATLINTPPNLLKLKLRNSLSAEEAFAALNTKLQSLSSTLHHLDGLPLPIRSVSAASKYTRSASRSLPLESGSARPIDVYVQFDTSGRWPDDLRAIQYTKIAFLTKIGDLLAQKDQSFQCRIGLEHASTSSIGTHNTSFLDVIQPSTPALPPFVFRLRIYHDREMHLIQQTLSSKNSLAPPIRETYQSALILHKRAQASISHTTAIRTLITAFPPLSATIRLLKQFLSAHRLSRHIPSEIAEIIAAYVFLRPAPWDVPGTATTAFARCLHFLARWDWSAEPLIVDLSLSQDMPLEQRQELSTRFLAWRKMDPNLNNVVWFVGTNLDATGVVWTQSIIPGQDPSPPRVIAGRLTALASAAVQLFQSVEQRESKIMGVADWNDVFASSDEHFDFVIHLKKGVSGNSKLGESGKVAKFKNLELAEVLDADTTGVEAVQCYLEDLERAFGHIAVFFHGDGNGNSSICGLWRPQPRKMDGKRELKIRLGVSVSPLSKHEVQSEEGKGEVNCTTNLSGMLAEMNSLGKGLVESITHIN